MSIFPEFWEQLIKGVGAVEWEDHLNGEPLLNGGLFLECELNVKCLFLSDPCAHGADHWVALSLRTGAF